jgi:hypothetical protein
MEIRSALAARLIAASPGAAIPAASVDWRDFQVFKPANGAVWYRASFLPGQPRAAAIGDTAQNRIPFVYQIDVYWPAGRAGGNAEAERVAACFRRGTGLTYNGVSVMCEMAYVGNDKQDSDFVQWPVKVQGWADVSN